MPSRRVKFCSKTPTSATKCVAITPHFCDVYMRYSGQELTTSTAASSSGLATISETSFFKGPYLFGAFGRLTEARVARNGSTTKATNHFRLQPFQFTPLKPRCGFVKNGTPISRKTNLL